MFKCSPVRQAGFGDRLTEFVGRFLAGSVGDQFDALHQAASADVTDDVEPGLQVQQPVLESLTEHCGALHQPVALDHP